MSFWKKNRTAIFAILACLCLICLGCRAYPELFLRLAVGLFCGLFFAWGLGFGIRFLQAAIVAFFLLIAVLNHFGIY